MLTRYRLARSFLLGDFLQFCKADLQRPKRFARHGIIAGNMHHTMWGQHRIATIAALTANYQDNFFYLSDVRHILPPLLRHSYITL